MPETIELILTLLQPGELHKLYRAILLVSTSSGWGEVKLTFKRCRLTDTISTVTFKTDEPDAGQR